MNDGNQLPPPKRFSLGKRLANMRYYNHEPRGRAGFCQADKRRTSLPRPALAGFRALTGLRQVPGLAARPKGIASNTGDRCPGLRETWLPAAESGISPRPLSGAMA